VSHDVCVLQCAPKQHTWLLWIVHVPNLMCLMAVELCCVGYVNTTGYLRFGRIENNIMFFVTSACARRTGVASQAFERMHNTLSHRSKT
jgi:hypothetical protein